MLICLGKNNKGSRSRWLKQHKSIFSQFWRWKVQDPGVGGLSFFSDPFPWLVDGYLLTVCACGPVCARGRVLISSSYKDTSHIGSGLTCMTPFYLNYVFKDSIFKYNHILRYQALRLQQMNFRGT